MKNNPYLPARRNPKRAPMMMLQSPPNSMGKLRDATELTTLANCNENALIASAFFICVSGSRYESYDDDVGWTQPAYSAFNFLINPDSLIALGRCSTPVGLNPRIEGASMMVYFGKLHTCPINNDVAF